MLADSLKEVTAGVHSQLEKKMDIMSHLNTRSDYLELVKKFYQYYLSVEPILKNFSPRLPMEGREKLPLLTKDLLNLGLSGADIEALTKAPIPSLQSLPEAIGALYVLEGSTLGGQVISKHLQNKLQITPDSGGAFFWAYGNKTMPMWLSFKNFLNSDDTAGLQENPKVLESAKETFLSMEKWLC